MLHGHERCGDLRDVILLGPDRAVMVMLDTTGTGTTGFVCAASILAGLRTAIEHDPDRVDLERTFNSINRSLAGKKTRQIVACCGVYVDLTTSSLTYLNAGMPPPTLLIAPGRTVSLDRSNLLLGVDGEYIHEHTTLELPDMFRLICYSDGLVEAVNISGTPFGDQALQDVITDRKCFATPSLIVEDALQQLGQHLDRKPIEDDATICVLSRG
jgi:sigma-B regulation protein RsbU (phosphoserine phosphatase)